jgi:hypothetical protein
MTKTLNQIIFVFLHQNQNILFSNIGNQNIFLEKNHNSPLQVKWSCEKIHLKFCKFILGVHKRTTNIAVLSELGRFPLYFNIIKVLIFGLSDSRSFFNLKNAFRDFLYNSF